MMEVLLKLVCPFTTQSNITRLQLTWEVNNSYQEYSSSTSSSEIMFKHNQTGNHKIPPTTTSICPVKKIAPHVTA